MVRQRRGQGLHGLQGERHGVADELRIVVGAKPAAGPRQGIGGAAQGVVFDRAAALGDDQKTKPGHRKDPSGSNKTAAGPKGADQRLRKVSERAWQLFGKRGSRSVGASRSSIPRQRSCYTAFTHMPENEPVSPATPEAPKELDAPEGGAAGAAGAAGPSTSAPAAAALPAPTPAAAVPAESESIPTPVVTTPPRRDPRRASSGLAGSSGRDPHRGPGGRDRGRVRRPAHAPRASPLP